MPEPPAWRYQKVIKPLFDLPQDHTVLRGRVLTCVGDEIIEDGFVGLKRARSRLWAAPDLGSRRRGGGHRRHNPARSLQQPRPPGLGRYPRSGPPVHGRLARDQRLQIRREHADQPAFRRHHH
ncbi:MAG: hypothetical protein R2856_33195 [Caldilineaceae bacterium]